MSATDGEMVWRSPLAGHVKEGRQGDPDAAVPGVTLGVVTGRDVVRISPFQGKRNPASAALRKLAGTALPAVGKSSRKGDHAVAWYALEAWIVMAPGKGRGELAGRLQRALKTSAAVVDQTHGITGIRVSGHNARDLLSKGVAVDLDPVAFPVGACAATQMEHVSVHLRRTGDDAYELLTPTSTVASFWHFLTDMALEFGFEADWA